MDVLRLAVRVRSEKQQLPVNGKSSGSLKSGDGINLTDVIELKKNAHTHLPTNN